MSQYTQCTYINHASWEESSAYTPYVLRHLWSLYHDIVIYVCIYMVYIQPLPIYTHITMSSYCDHKFLFSGNVYLTNAVGWCPPMMHAYMYIYTLIAKPSIQCHWHSKPRTMSSQRAIDTTNFISRPVTESLTHQISFYTSSHNKPCTTSSNRVTDTANLIPRPVTKSLTQQTINVPIYTVYLY